VGALAGFIVRLVGYALLFGVTARVAEALWVQQGLDNAIDLQNLHDLGIRILIYAPFVAALLGIRRYRRIVVFLAAFLVGAALTAPFACARFAGV
jgi:hypothetical protein